MSIRDVAIYQHKSYVCNYFSQVMPTTSCLLKKLLDLIKNIASNICMDLCFSYSDSFSSFPYSRNCQGLWFYTLALLTPTGIPSDLCPSFSLIPDHWAFWFSISLIVSIYKKHMLPSFLGRGDITAGRSVFGRLI